MSSDPPTKRAALDPSVSLPSDAEVEDAYARAGDGGRPTVVPPFDVHLYAREVAAMRSLAPAGMEAPPTLVPPPEVILPVGSPFTTFRAPAETVTNEFALEEARRISAVPSSTGIRIASEAPTAQIASLGVHLAGEPSLPPSSAHPAISLAPQSAAPSSVAEGSEGTGPPPTLPSRSPLAGPASAPPLSVSFDRSTKSSVLSLADARILTPSTMSLHRQPRRISSADRLPRSEDDDAAPPPLDPAIDMRDRFSLGDYTGALAVAEQVLGREPKHAEALRVAEECQRVLVKMYAARIGPLDRVPAVLIQPHELKWLTLDHKAGFLLSLVDGMSTIEMLLDVSGMPLLDTLRILDELSRQKVISFR